MAPIRNLFATILCLLFVCTTTWAAPGLTSEENARHAYSLSFIPGDPLPMSVWQECLAGLVAAAALGFSLWNVGEDRNRRERPWEYYSPPASVQNTSPGNP